MTNLLHIDCSLRSKGSMTRKVNAIFAELWRQTNPTGSYTYRDLGAMPVPHLDEASVMAGLLPAEQRSDAQHTGWSVSEPLITELRAANVILLGVPMYNYSIPSALKAWLDRVTIKEHMANEATGIGGLLEGKQVVVITARGGAYGPGTLRENYDFQEPYLRAALGQIGLAKNLEFVHIEMTLAHSVPHLAQFKEVADVSRDEAERIVRKLAVTC